MSRRLPLAEIPESLVNGRVILLDLDGTLVPDGSDVIDPGTRRIVAKWAALAEVYVVTNGGDRLRSRRLAKELGLPLIEEGKKPHPQAAGPHRGAANLTVIGDKFLTDGLFARRLGATFIQVPRLRSGRERLSTRLVNAADDVVSWLI